MSLTAVLPPPPKSNRSSATRKASDVSAEYGVPSPRPRFVIHMAPAGTSDSRPPRSNETKPLATYRWLFPALSTSSLYSQPRSTAAAEGVSTINSRGGADIFACNTPRSSDSRCSVVVVPTSLTREFGSISTLPIFATVILARDAASVSSTSPTPRRSLLEGVLNVGVPETVSTGHDAAGTCSGIWADSTAGSFEFATSGSVFAEGVLADEFAGTAATS